MLHRYDKYLLLFMYQLQLEFTSSQTVTISKITDHTILPVTLQKHVAIVMKHRFIVTEI